MTLRETAGLFGAEASLCCHNMKKLTEVKKKC